MTPDDPRHGTHRGYVIGCREQCCRDAQTKYMKLYRLGRRPKLIDATGTVRRVQALYALGWSSLDVGERCGRSREWARIVTRSPTVTTTTAAIIEAAFESMCMTVPTGGYAERSRRMARRKGWAPPLAWNDIDDPNESPATKQTSRPKTDVDPVVILRVIAGDKLPMTTAERRAVVAQARGLGWSEETIHARTGIAKATDKTRFGDHFPDCGCMPGTAENGWIEKQAAGCAAEQVGRAA